MHVLIAFYSMLCSDRAVVILAGLESVDRTIRRLACEEASISTGQSNDGRNEPMVGACRTRSTLRRAEGR